MLSEWLQGIHYQGPMSQLTAHIHNSFQEEWEWLHGAPALRGQSMKDQQNV